jgi:hypothetical protein
MGDPPGGKLFTFEELTLAVTVSKRSANRIRQGISTSSYRNNELGGLAGPGHQDKCKTLLKKGTTVRCAISWNSLADGEISSSAAVQTMNEGVFLLSHAMDSFLGWNGF